MFSLDKLVVIIVLYKEKLLDATPFRIEGVNSIAVDWFVYDNSPEIDPDAGNYSFVKYTHDPTNPGVSMAYNKGAEYARALGKEWVLLFDQDTELPTDFFEVLVNKVNSGPESQLYAMKLFKEGALISPGGYKYKRGYMLTDMKTGENSMNNVTFLNSGLLVSLDLFFEAGGYDENVPLYFSDFIFINRIRKVSRSFTLLPVNLMHNLSSNDMTNIGEFKARYDLYLKGIKESIMSEDNGHGFYYSVSFLRALKLTFTLRDRYYLKSYWRHLCQ